MRQRRCSQCQKPGHDRRNCGGAKRRAACHPDRPHSARGLCKPCYRKWFLGAHPESWARKNETERRRYANDREAKLALGRRWRSENPERAAALARSQYNATRLTRREQERARLYGLRPGQYDEMLRTQGGVCFICAKSSKVRALCVDHCHATGAVRRLLCNSCNFLVGWIEKRGSALMARAAEYLESFTVSRTAAVVGQGRAEQEPERLSA